MAGKGKHPGGRPRVMKGETKEKFLTAVQAGNYIETAAAFAGISKDTVYDWMKKGARAKRKENPTESEKDYIEFSDALERAMAEAEVMDLHRIGEAAKDGAWQASAWRLERKYPEKWGRRDRHDVLLGGMPEGGVSVNIVYE